MGTNQPHLELTDTVTSIKFMDLAATTAVLIAAMPYRLSYGGWSPQVARRNKNPLGLPYVPVRETITVDIFGTSASDCYTKLQALNTLLDQGERWYNNEVVNPVFIRYQPLGSDKTTYMKDVVIGGAADDSNATLLELPNDFNFTGFSSKLKGITVSFWRRNGFWLGEDETQQLSNQAQRTVNFVTWSVAAANLSPMAITIAVNTTHDTLVINGILVTTHNDTFIGIVNGESIGGVATADAANNAVGTNVGRFTCSTTPQHAFKQLFTEELYLCEYVAIYATMRNNSTTLDVYIQPNVNFTNFEIFLPEIKLPFATTPNPQVVFLGMVPTRGRQPYEIGFYYRSLSGTPTFDVDQLLYFGVNRATNVLAINAIRLGTSLVTDPLSVQHLLLREPQPEVSYKEPATFVQEERLTYSGSAYQFTGGSGTRLKTAYMLFATQGAKWQISTAANAACTLSPKFIRSKAYLLPE